MSSYLRSVNQTSPVKVALCVYPDISIFEFATAYEIFSTYGRSYKPWYDTHLVSVADEPVSIAGAQLQPDYTERSLSDFDIIILPGWRDIKQRPSRAFITNLEIAAARGARIVSFCSGAFALAHTGLLNGKRATTHWQLEEQFKHLFPGIKLEINKLYTQCGNFYTSAGSSACLDLSLELIRQDFGVERANEVARRLVISGYREGGQKQFIEYPVPRKRTEIGDIMDWALEHLDEPILIETMAQMANMSRRNFDRKFKRSFGTTPKQWLTRAKIEHAKQLLDATQSSIDQIAELVGYSSTGSFRASFEQHEGLSPAKYREARQQAKRKKASLENTKQQSRVRLASSS